MRNLKISVEGRSYTFKVPESYGEMNERQYFASMLHLMHLIERSSFWYRYVGLKPSVCDKLPEWVLMRMDEMLSFIPELTEQLDRFIIEQLPQRGVWSKRLSAPEPMLANVTLQQFMTADSYFSYYCVTQRESFIDRLAASLYLAKHETFITENKKDVLVPIDKREAYIHKYMPVEVRFGIFMNWIMIKNWLSKCFPNMFPHGSSDGKPKASDWLGLFDSFVGDNIPFMKDYQRMACMDAFRIIDAKVKSQNERK